MFGMGSELKTNHPVLCVYKNRARNRGTCTGGELSGDPDLGYEVIPEGLSACERGGHTKEILGNPASKIACSLKGWKPCGLVGHLIRNWESFLLQICFPLVM